MANFEVTDLIDLSDEQKIGKNDVPGTSKFAENNNLFDQLLNGQQHGVNDPFNAMQKQRPKSPYKEVKTAQLLPLFHSETEELNQNLDDNNIFSSGTHNMDDMPVNSAVTQVSAEQQPFSFLKMPQQDSCDDLMNIEPNWIESDSDIDSDLEMLTIPALEKWKDYIDERLQGSNTIPVSSTRDVSMSTPADRTQINLRAIKDRLEQIKSQLKPNQTTVETLKESINKIISEWSSGDGKVKEVNELLESLCATLSKSTEKQLLQLNEPITRQSNFTMDDQRREVLPAINSPSVSSSGAAHTIENANHENPQLMQKIEEVFGSGSVVNVASAAAGNPTIIVVMGTPVPPIVRQTSEIYTHVGDGSPDFTGSKLRPRAQSLTAPKQTDKLPLRRSPLKTPNTTVLQKTPVRFATPNLASVKRSIYATKPSESSLSVNADNTKKRSSIAGGIENRKATKAESDEQPALAKKLKIKTREVVKESRGPLKATIPVTKITSTLPTQSKPSPNKDNTKPSRSSFCRLSPRFLPSANRRLSATPSARSTNDLQTLPRRRTITEGKQLNKTLQPAKGSNLGRLQSKPSSAEPAKKWSIAKTVRTMNN